MLNAELLNPQIKQSHELIITVLLKWLDWLFRVFVTPRKLISKELQQLNPRFIDNSGDAHPDE